MRKPGQSTWTGAYRARNPNFRMLENVRTRARRLGIECTIGRNDLQLPNFCPVLGIEIDYSLGRGAGPKPNSPSVDRTNPDSGYIPGNVVVMSAMANAMKSNATPEQLRLFARWVRKIYGE